MVIHPSFSLSTLTLTGVALLSLDSMLEMEFIPSHYMKLSFLQLFATLHQQAMLVFQDFTSFVLILSKFFAQQVSQKNYVWLQGPIIGKNIVTVRAWVLLISCPDRCVTL